MTDWKSIVFDLAPLLVIIAMGFPMVTMTSLLLWPIRFVKWWRIIFTFIGFLLTGAANFWVATKLDYPTMQIHFAFAVACLAMSLLTFGAAKERLEWEYKNLFFVI